MVCTNGMWELMELMVCGIKMHITSMTHCGMDLVVSLATAVTTLPNHGFTKS